MIWGFWIELRGPARLWTASIGFTLVGSAIVVVLPRYLPAVEQDPVAAIAIGALGWAFVVLGLIVLLPMLATLYVRARRPERERVWFWWINFIGGLCGALTFAIPAALMLPLFSLAYLMRPNALFPAGDANPAHNLCIAALFSLIGLITLAATVFLARATLRENPRRRDPIEWRRHRG